MGSSSPWVLVFILVTFYVRSTNGRNLLLHKPVQTGARLCSRNGILHTRMISHSPTMKSIMEWVWNYITYVFLALVTMNDANECSPEECIGYFWRQEFGVWSLDVFTESCSVCVRNCGSTKDRSDSWYPSSSLRPRAFKWSTSSGQAICLVNYITESDAPFKIWD